MFELTYKSEFGWLRSRQVKQLYSNHFLGFVNNRERLAYFRRNLKMSTMAAITRAAPTPMIDHAQAGVAVAGAGTGGADGSGAASVLKLTVADQSLGAGSRAITCQK